VLVLEDNPTDVFVIKEVLANCGLSLKPHIVRDGQEAVQYLQALELNLSVPCPALVLLDLNLPRVDGIGVLRQLRHLSRCSKVPVIVVTSSGAEADRTAAGELGADYYFQKPTELSAYMQLGDVIKTVLKAGG